MNLATKSTNVKGKTATNTKIHSLDPVRSMSGVAPQFYSKA